ncbi:hypothetical protein BSM4216_2163 [Bacillus smithii]|nr:hypothetical protein BSM4216_2163 [Bacillus smithii]
MICAHKTIITQKRSAISNGVKTLAADTGYLGSSPPSVESWLDILLF